MILGLSTITRREKETEKRFYSGLSIGIVALVMIILVSAYQRISLAIDWHGFSRLRLYPQVFLVWLGILFVSVVILEIFRQERYFAFAAVLASLGFAVSLTFMNVDDAIVKHNVPRVLEVRIWMLLILLPYPLMLFQHWWSNIIQPHTPKKYMKGLVPRSYVTWTSIHFLVHMIMIGAPSISRAGKRIMLCKVYRHLYKITGLRISLASTDTQ